MIPGLSVHGGIFIRGAYEDCKIIVEAGDSIRSKHSLLYTRVSVVPRILDKDGKPKGVLSKEAYIPGHHYLGFFKYIIDIHTRVGINPLSTRT